MSAFACILSPVSYGSAIELSGGLFRKKLLPVGSIQYQDRQLNFTREYLAGLLRAWQDRAYDSIPVQFADASNAHTLDPERTRGQIVDMTLEPDGLWVTAQLSQRGQRVLSEHPYIGVSARIVEQYQRSDGRFYPAAVQHILATTDPRIPGLGAWQAVEMGNTPSVTIDLSNLSFSGEPEPDYTLSGLELNQLLDAISETDSEFGTEVYYGDTEGQMHDAAEQFDAAFTARVQADQDREDARAAAIVEDVLHPVRRAEDKIARIMARAADGVYSGQLTDFATEQAAVEIVLANGGHGPCSAVDSYGRCGARYHDLLCQHSQSVEWLASGPPPSTGAAALANLAGRMQLDLSRRSVWGDPDDPDEPSYEMPAHTIELAHELATDWGLGDVPADLLRPPAMAMSPYDQMYAEVSYEDPAPQPRMGRPGIAELRERMGI
jgi:hypothetical protein